jgi:OOP family OmpA-OmpF porin
MLKHYKNGRFSASGSNKMKVHSISLPKWSKTLALAAGASAALSACVIARHSDEPVAAAVPPPPPVTEPAVAPPAAAPAPVISQAETDASELRDLMKAAEGKLHFSFDSVELNAEAKQEIGRIGDLLAKNLNEKIRIDGFTDGQGTPKYNRELSEQRTQVVTGILLERGVKPSQIEAEGHGEDHPVANNTTEDGRAMNRRVELKLETPPTG